MIVKYPRTQHFPFSPGATNDDKICNDYSFFEGKEVVFTEKMDGENTSMYSDYFHARSLDSKHHESRNYVKGIWGNIKYIIPEGWRICGENLYAKHSIEYQDLNSYFQVFSIWNENNYCLSWNDTETFCAEMQLWTVPILYRGLWNEKKLHEIIKNLDLTKQEGVVVRLANSFKFEDFNRSVVKWVREAHVQTNEHWMNNKIIPNKLK